MINNKKIYQRIVAIATSEAAKKGVQIAQDIIKKYDNPKTPQKLAPNLIYKRQKPGIYVLTYRRISFRERIKLKAKKLKSDVWNPTVFLEYGSPQYKNFNPPKGFYKKAKEEALKDSQALEKANKKITRFLEKETTKAMQQIIKR